MNVAMKGAPSVSVCLLGMTRMVKMIVNLRMFVLGYR